MLLQKIIDAFEELKSYVFIINRGNQKAWCDDHNGKYIFGFNKGGYCIYE